MIAFVKLSRFLSIKTCHSKIEEKFIFLKDEAIISKFFNI